MIEFEPPLYELVDKFLQKEKLEKNAREAYKYVMTKELTRPKTTYLTVFLSVVLYLTVAFFTALGIKLFFFMEYSVWAIFLLTFLTSFLFVSNYLCIKVVECYQHYAKEETRRKCLCKPTCSEYAICVLKKQFILIALYKIYKRLFKTCRGGIYKIDFP